MIGGTKEIIVNCAFRTMDGEGLEYISYANIEKECGLETDCVAKYYPNILDLHADMAISELKNLALSLPPEVENNKFANLNGIIHAFFERYRKYPNRYFFLMRKWNEKPSELLEIANAVSEGFVKIYQDYFSRPIKGIDSEKIAYFFLSLSMGAISMEITNHLKRPDGSDVINSEEIISIALGLMSNR